MYAGHALTWVQRAFQALCAAVSGGRDLDDVSGCVPLLSCDSCSFAFAGTTFNPSCVRGADCSVVRPAHPAHRCHVAV